jgi:hypothetical protein
MQDEDLITYCGHYGGTCARYRGYTAFRGAAAMLAELCDAHGFQHWMPGEVKEFDYPEFRKGLEFFSRDDTWFVCQGCCKGAGGGPPGCVRSCCEEHGVDVCFECTEFPCGKVADDEEMMGRAREYQRLGREEWLRQQVEKAREGWELHTGKRYTIQVTGDG